MSYDSLYKLYYKDKELYKSTYDNRINSENTIKFDFKIYGNDAFVFLHKDIMSSITHITFLDKSISNLLSSLPLIAREQYIKKSLIDEIVYTNEIEGIVSTRKQINELINDIECRVTKKERFSSLVHKYMLLMNDKFKGLDSPTNIRDIYNELVLDEIIKEDPNDVPDGIIFRAGSVEVKSRTGKILHEGVMPESEIISMISKAINIINDINIEPLVRISVFHYVFSYIHPFYDGNGRTNRYISSLYLKNHFESIVAYRLSLTMKENLKQYYDAFEKTNSKINLGDISTFVYEFVDIVRKSFEATIEYLEIKKNQLINFEKLIKELNLNESLSNMLYVFSQIELFGGVEVNSEQIGKILDISRPTCTKNIKTLLENELLVNLKDGKTNYYRINAEKFNYK